MSPVGISPQEAQDLRERLTEAEKKVKEQEVKLQVAEMKFDLFQERYEQERMEHLKHREELAELIMIIRIVGIRKIIVGAVLFYLAYPMLSHKIMEYLGAVGK